MMRRYIVVYLLCCLVLLAPPANAFIKAQEITSPGGIKAWFVFDPVSPLISIDFSFKGGGSVDPAEREGTADMLSSLLLEGTGNMDKKELAAKLQDLAINVNFDAEMDFLSGSLQTIYSNRDEAFQLLGQLLSRPRFNDLSALEHIKSLHLTYLANIAQNPGALAVRKANQILYPNHSYGRPVYGTEQAVRAMSMEDLRNYFKTYINSTGLIIGITGKITVEEAGRLIDMSFGVLPNHEVSDKVQDVTPAIAKAPIVIDQDIPQSTVLFAQNGWRYGHPDFYKASVLLHVLGSGDTSRLVDEIREKRGFAYYVYSRMNPSKHSGLVAGKLGTANANVDQAVRLVRTEWQRMRDHGVTQKELQSAKTYLINSFPLRFGNSAQLAAILKAYQIFGFDISYFQKRRELIESLTLEEVNKLASSLLKPEELTFVIVGRPDNMMTSSGERNF